MSHADSGSSPVYAMVGRRTDAVELVARLLTLRGDLDLLAEEADPVSRHQLGNDDEALSHIPSYRRRACSPRTS